MSDYMRGLGCIGADDKFFVSQETYDLMQKLAPPSKPTYTRDETLQIGGQLMQASVEDYKHLTVAEPNFLQLVGALLLGGVVGIVLGRRA